MFKKFTIIIMILLLPLVSCEIPKVIEESKIIAVAVITEEAEVLPTSAILNGNLLEIDQDIIIDYGFEWWNAIDELKQQISLGEMSEERFFSYQLDALSEQIEYFYQAYVKTEEAVIYGEIKMFVPLPEEIPPVVNVEMITLNVNELFLNLEETAQLNAVVLPEEAVDKTFSWTSNDPNIIEIDETGLITGKNIGIAFIKAKANCNEIEDVCKILVIYPSIGDFKFDELPETIEKYTSLNIIPSEDVEILNITSNNENVTLILENTLNFMGDGEAELNIEYSDKCGEIKTEVKTIIIGKNENMDDAAKGNGGGGKGGKTPKEPKRTKWYGNPDIPEALWHINTATWRIKIIGGVKHWIDDKNRHWLADGTYLYTDSYIDPPPPPEWDY